MTNKGSFSLGCLTGFVLAIIAIFIFGAIVAGSASNHGHKNIEYFDVKGKKGEVTLHTYMPKDSVKIYLGKPDRTNVHSIGGDNHEEWEYDFPHQGKYGTTRELTISFVNGELKSVHDL